MFLKIFEKLWFCVNFLKTEINFLKIFLGEGWTAGSSGAGQDCGRVIRTQQPWVAIYLESLADPDHRILKFEGDPDTTAKSSHLCRVLQIRIILMWMIPQY